MPAPLHFGFHIRGEGARDQDVDARGVFVLAGWGPESSGATASPLVYAVTK
jgi:hypothetical protein